MAQGTLEKVENDYDIINGVSKSDGITIVIKHKRCAAWHWTTRAVTLRAEYPLRC